MVEFGIYDKSDGLVVFEIDEADVLAHDTLLKRMYLKQVPVSYDNDTIIVPEAACRNAKAFEDVTESFFTHQKFLVPLIYKPATYDAKLRKEGLASYIRTWSRLGFPKDTSYRIAHNTLRREIYTDLAQKKEAIEVKLSLGNAFKKELEDVIALLEESEYDDLFDELTILRAHFREAVQETAYVPNEWTTQDLITILESTDEHTKSAQIIKVLDDLLTSTDAVLTRTSSWSERRKQFALFSEYFNVEDMRRLRTLELMRPRFEAVEQYPLVDSTVCFLESELATISAKMRALGL